MTRHDRVLCLLEYGATFLLTTETYL